MRVAPPVVAVVGLVAGFSLACADKTPAPPTDTPAVTAAPTPPSAVPDTFRVAFETSKGRFVVEVRRAWAPIGVGRLFDLVNINYFAEARFFRVIPGFVAQFGMHADPATNGKWAALAMPDDPFVQSNKRGTLVFANRGPNSRSNQFFINLADNPMLDAQAFTPLGEVVEGMAVVDAIYGGYGDGSNNQPAISAQGNAFLTREFPKLDYIKTATIVPR